MCFYIFARAQRRVAWVFQVYTEGKEVGVAWVGNAPLSHPRSCNSDSSMQRRKQLSCQWGVFVRTWYGYRYDPSNFGQLESVPGRSIPYLSIYLSFPVECSSFRSIFRRTTRLTVPSAEFFKGLLSNWRCRNGLASTCHTTVGTWHGWRQSLKIEPCKQPISGRTFLGA